MSDQQSTNEQLQGENDAAEEIQNEAGVDDVGSEEQVAPAAELLEEVQEVKEGESDSNEGAEPIEPDTASATAEPTFEAAEPSAATTDPLSPGVQDASTAAPVAEAVSEPIPVAEPVVEIQPAVDQSEGSSENQQYLNNIRENGTLIQKQALDALDQFCTRMRPRAPISATQAMEAQRDLLDFITVLLRKDYEDFRKGWATMLVYFAEHHGDRPTAKDYTPLSEYSTSRHLDSWKDEERANAYNNLLTLLRVTRNSETRKQDVKRVRLDAIAPTFLNARCMDNLQRFYA